ncbi:MAG: hypothetical protein IJQ16_02320 [Selenomonadaceae bacterium]|nr:hypothetical protein [Selenomonadaceae bacterium]
MKKFLALIVAAIILMTANVLASNYVGNSKTKKFHYADCSAAQKIKSSNRVSFNSRDAAVSGGYVPCKICKP